MPSVLFDIKDGTGLITLNRPEKRNAINMDLLIHFYDALDEVIANPDINAVIITGNGPSFCAGLDLSSIGRENLFDPRGDGRGFPELISECRVPVIGAINGHAITGGLEIALNCDFLIASENASFKDTHAKVGLPSGWGLSQLLQHAVGQRMAKQMSFSGKVLSAGEALRCGLINEMLPADKLMERAFEIAQTICAGNRNIIGIMKDIINRGGKTTLAKGLEIEQKVFLDFIRPFQNIDE